MDLSSLILALDGYNKIFYFDENYKECELTIQKCIEFANYKIERISIRRNKNQINVLIEFKKEQPKGIEVENYYR